MQEPWKTKHHPVKDLVDAKLCSVGQVAARIQKFYMYTVQILNGYAEPTAPVAERLQSIITELIDHDGRREVKINRRRNDNQAA